MICLFDCERSSVWKNEIEVLEFISALNNCGHSSILVHLVEGIIWLTLPQWVQEDLDIWVNSLSDVLFSHFLSEELHFGTNFRINVGSMRIMHFLNTGWWSKQELTKSISFNHCLKISWNGFWFLVLDSWGTSCSSSGCWLTFGSKISEGNLDKLIVSEFTKYFVHF